MYFDGEPNPRKINLGGRSKASGSRGDLMRKAREERHERAEQKRRTGASTRVAAWWRGRSAAAKARRAVRQAWDGQMRDLEAVRTVFASRGARFEAPPATVSALAQSFLFFANNTRAVFFCKKGRRLPAPPRDHLRLPLPVQGLRQAGPEPRSVPGPPRGRPRRASRRGGVVVKEFLVVVVLREGRRFGGERRAEGHAGGALREGDPFSVGGEPRTGVGEASRPFLVARGLSACVARGLA
mmetsp:Transcript_36561/g.117244  ORF Transcript_36561/g.117244 Transcript_36561/m.117244 type:complete len:240 (+) Transcript_36561:168-887(+)